MFEKISRAKFMRDYEGKKMTLMLAGDMDEENFNGFMHDFEDDEIYTQAATQKSDKKYTGILHKYSKGFYREMEDNDRSYYYFKKGSYIESDGKFSIIITPLDPTFTDKNGNRFYQVTLYRKESD